MGEPGIVMEFTSEPRHARVARAAIAATAVLEDFSVERIDDVRLLVDEAFNALVLTGASRVTFALVVGAGLLELSVCGVGSRVDDELAVLGVLGDAIAPGWRLDSTDDGVTFDAVIRALPA